MRDDSMWWAYIADYDGEPGSTIVNLSWRTLVPVAKWPIAVICGMPYYSDPSLAGLPEPTDLDFLNLLSAKRRDFVLERSSGVQVGTFSYKLERLDYFYVDCDDGLHAALEDYHKRVFPGQKCHLNIKPDPEWNAYSDFLYPNRATIDFHHAELKTLGFLKRMQ